MNFATMVFITTLFSITVYLMVSLGAIFNERSGVVNISLDGQMIFGGFGYTLTAIYLQPLIGDYAQFVGYIVAIIIGIVISCIHAFVSINLNSDQIISGLAINLFAAALTMFIIKSYFKIDHLQDPTQVVSLGTLPLPVIIAIIIIIASGIFICRTKLGKRMVATGENPNAVDALGISVYKMRYLGVLTSGGLSGLGGAFFIQAVAAGRFAGTANGLGYISIAIMIVGQWRIIGILLGSIFFGFISSIATYSAQISGISAIPSEVWMMAPFVFTIIMMMFTARNTHVPKASGQPYDKSKR